MGLKCYWSSFQRHTLSKIQKNHIVNKTNFAINKLKCETYLWMFLSDTLSGAMVDIDGAVLEGPVVRSANGEICERNTHFQNKPLARLIKRINAARSPS